MKYLMCRCAIRICKFLMFGLFTSSFGWANPNDVPYGPGGIQAYKVVENEQLFITQTFKYHSSALVGLKFSENGQTIAVSSAHSRGRNVFSGSASGGAVGVCGKATVGSEQVVLGSPDLSADNGCGAETNGHD